MVNRFCPYCQNQIPQEAHFCPFCGQSASGSLTGRLPAQFLLDGRYLIVRLVGQGGMGAVYQAVDTRIQGRVCAVKEMSIHALPPEERAAAVQNFEQEAQLLARLRHPYLPQVHDFFQDGSSGRYYLVMDFVEGETLATILAREGALPEHVVREWGDQLCEVLHYLHQQTPPIVFRDLKPGNIMLDRSGHIKLIDFGIARFFKPTQTKDTQVIGTPGYAAPEQYGHGQTDARSDIYGLGVTLLTLLTGYDPAQNPFALPAARQLNPAVSPQITAVIQRATQIKPEQRWQSTAELRQALATGRLVGKGAKKETASSSGRRLLWAGVALLLLVLLGVGAWTLAGQTELWPNSSAATTMSQGETGEASANTIVTTAPIEEEAHLALATSTPAPEPTSTQEATAVATAIPTPEDTATPEPTPEPSPEPSPEATPTPEPPTAVPTATATQSPTPTPFADTVIEVTVLAAQARTETGLMVRAGQQLVVEYLSGSWRAGPLPTWPLVGPEGDPQVASKSIFPVPTSPIMTLVAGIGQERPLAISGVHVTFVATADGLLWLGPNDDNFQDNVGSLTVRITLTN